MHVHVCAEYMIRSMEFWNWMCIHVRSMYDTEEVVWNFGSKKICGTVEEVPNKAGCSFRALVLVWLAVTAHTHIITFSLIADRGVCGVIASLVHREGEWEVLHERAHNREGSTFSPPKTPTTTNKQACKQGGMIKVVLHRHSNSLLPCLSLRMYVMPSDTRSQYAGQDVLSDSSSLARFVCPTPYFFVVWVP